MASRLISALGGKLINQTSLVGAFMLYVKDTVREMIKPPYRPYLILQYMHFAGNQSLAIIVTSAFFVGAVFALQIGVVFKVFAAEGMMGAATGKALAQELAPLLTGFLLAGRAGSAITAEIATMKVNEQIDAMEAMAVEPINYLVVPRFIALVIMAPLLSSLFVLIGEFGAYLVGISIFNVDEASFFSRILEVVSSSDLWSGLQKATVFGGVVALVACRFGLEASGGAKGVGKATTNSVVITLLLLLLIDLFMTYVQVIL